MALSDNVFTCSFNVKSHTFHVFNDISLVEVLNHTNIPLEEIFVTCNGKIISGKEILNPGFIYHYYPRVLGGKGGFGSMLRAIGAQIEKTTNREACRDLSGRRMRDVNNEQKLRDWVKDKAKREREKEEKRKERAEKRKYELTNTRHTFEDQDYQRQKMQVLEELDSAITQGLQKSSSGGTPSTSATASISASNSGNSRKRKANRPGPEAMKKACEWLGVDIANLSDLSDSSGSESEGENSGEGTSASGSLPQLKEGSEFFQMKEDTGSQSKSKEATISTPPSSYLDQEGKSLDVAHDESEKGKGKGKKSGLLDTLSNLPPKDNVATESNESENSKSEDCVHGKESSGVDSKHKVAANAPAIDPTEPVDLDPIESMQKLEELGLDRLKNALMTRGLKCGGTLQQRAERLWSVKGKTKEEIDPSLFAKPAKKKK